MSLSYKNTQFRVPLSVFCSRRLMSVMHHLVPLPLAFSFILSVGGARRGQQFRRFFWPDSGSSSGHWLGGPSLLPPPSSLPSLSPGVGLGKDHCSPELSYLTLLILLHLLSPRQEFLQQVISVKPSVVCILIDLDCKSGLSFFLLSQVY